MSVAARSGIKVAIGLSVLLHLLLFTVFHASVGHGLGGALVPPETHYLGNAAAGGSVANGRVRTVLSPVVFSLPSEMGFSRTLYNDPLRTRLTFSQPVESERFLAVETARRDSDAPIDAGGLMLTGARASLLAVPEQALAVAQKGPSARRVNMAPALKERLAGGVVLPPALNQAADSAWQVKAAVSISAAGRVRHVFLDQPLESPALNLQVLQLLYGLRFKSGAQPVEGSVEIYSPEPVGPEGAP